MNEAAQPISSSRNSKAGSPAAAAERNSPGASFSRSLRNVLWMSSISVVTRVLNLAHGIILARLLTPFDFGVYGLAGSIVGIKECVADIGAGSFLVYRPGEAEQHAETTLRINLTLTAFLLVFRNICFIQCDAQLVPARGPTSWRKVAYKQVEVLPQVAVGELPPYFRNLHYLMRTIERRDMKCLKAGPSGRPVPGVC